LYRQLVDNILAEQGFDNDHCQSIEQAQQFLDSENYDLVCVNNHLEDGPDSEFIAYCNHHDVHSETPILLLTSDDKSEENHKSLKIDEIIVKRNLNQITDQITRFVETHLDKTFLDGRILFVEDSKVIAAIILTQLE
jgi:DNA-binding NtrC family response regulator